MERKYNNLSSFDIFKLSDEELKDAIHEWAMEDVSLEKLLWKCYNNGVVTHGCHVGPMSYLSLSADYEVEKVKNMINSVYQTDGFSLLIAPDGGNPFSGDIFYKPDLSIVFLKTHNQKMADELLDKMSCSIDQNVVCDNDIINSFIDLYAFFSGRESDLEFRLNNNNGTYSFSVELHSGYNFDYYDNLFNNTDLVLNKNNFFCWQIVSSDLREFSKKLKEIKNVLIKNYDLDIPNKIEDNMSFNEMFRIIRRKYLSIYGDEVEYKKFSSEFEKEFHKKMEIKSNNNESGNSLWQWVVQELTLKSEQLDKMIKSMN